MPTINEFGQLLFNHERPVLVLQYSGNWHLAIDLDEEKRTRHGEGVYNIDTRKLPKRALSSEIL